jgi:hypothetical protein
MTRISTAISCDHGVSGKKLIGEAIGALESQGWPVDFRSDGRARRS